MIIWIDFLGFWIFITIILNIYTRRREKFQYPEITEEHIQTFIELDKEILGLINLPEPYIKEILQSINFLPKSEKGLKKMERRITHR
jgi:hypothetical protein